MDDLRLRPASPEDRFRIRRLLADPAFHAWWGNAASVEAEINLAMNSNSALCRIVEAGGAAVGYGQAADIALWNEAWPEELLAGTWDVHAFVATADRRDLVHLALALLTEEVFATTLAVACCAVVSIRNEEAVRAYERAGFRWQRVWNDRLTGPSWLMLKERLQRPPAR